MAIDRGKTLRGALAGSVAAAVWAAQAPLDKRAFECECDDVELLGKAFTRERSWPLLGWVLHIQIGALFGAAYTNLAGRLPLPSWARAPLLALAEHFATWPLMALSDRFHPAREELPKAFTNRRALAQATWRHLLFGFLLGQLERMFNSAAEVQMPDYEQVISSNGHGSLEHATSAS